MSFCWITMSSTQTETEVETVFGGKVGAVEAYNNAAVTLAGGIISEYIYGYDNAVITFNDGLTGMDIAVYDNATVNMAGGFLGGDLVANNTAVINMTGGSVGQLIADNDSTITWSGGSVGTAISVYGNGRIFLDGTNFRINGQVLGYGDNLSNFVTLTEAQGEDSEEDYYIGTVTGTLSDESYFSETFYIYNVGEFEGSADIIILPEPATLMLLGLGGMAALKRRVQ